MSDNRNSSNFLRKQFSTKNNKLDDSLLNKIHNQNSLDFLKTLPDNCIDAIITSPPYNFKIDYDSYDDNKDWKVYFDEMFAIMRECVRVLKDSGRLCVNIASCNTQNIPTHHLFSNFLLNEGLIWKGEIIWDRHQFNVPVYCYGTYKSPASPVLKISWEFIEIFCKNSTKKDGDADKIDITEDEFKEYTNSRWVVVPEQKMKSMGHNAMFPKELVRRLVKFFTYKDDIILDPFNGCGTTTLVCHELGRKYIGVELSEQYCKMANERLKWRYYD